MNRKDERIALRATPPTCKRVDLKTFELSDSGLRSKFDVILIDPPWDEYRRRKAAAGSLMKGACVTRVSLRDAVPEALTVDL